MAEVNHGAQESVPAQGILMNSFYSVWG